MSVFITVVELICYNDVWLENEHFSTFHLKQDWLPPKHAGNKNM